MNATGSTISARIDALPSPPWSAVQLRRVAGGDDAWVLLADRNARVQINGSCLPHGISVLADRDEIRCAAAPSMFFSTERLATVAPFPDGAHGFCPRCKQTMVAGLAAVRCPGCGLWHHASDEHPCWTYGDQCASCAQPTARDAGFQWTPEEL